MRFKLQGAVIGLLSLGSFGIPMAGTLEAQDVVFPGDPSWQTDNRGLGTGAITGTNPRSGNGSLELLATGALTDWAFFRTVAGVDSLTSSWGLLDNVNHLQFDWFRASLANQTVNDVPWQAQTPVLRLFLRQDIGGAPLFSELVWEQFYTDPSPAVTDKWVTENITGESVTDQVFWRFVQASTGGFTINDCSNIDPFFPNPLKTATSGGWATDPNCSLSGAQVWGLSVGVGSNWPDRFQGFADNVQLGFADDEDLAVNANFELPSTPVPEPSTILLLATGLAGVGASSWWRRRRTRG